MEHMDLCVHIYVQIHDDFNEMVQRVSDLKAVWTTAQPQILQRVTKAAAGNADLVALLQNIQEEFDEGGQLEYLYNQ